MRSLRLFVGPMIVLGGCSAIVSPDPARLGGSDAGRLDAAVARDDAFVPPGVDADLRVPDAWSPSAPDAWSPDRPDAFMPMTCVDGSVRCEGNVRVACVAGREERTDCALGGGMCVAGACRSTVCAPGSTMCSADGTGVVTCSPDGTSVSYARCPSGTCSAATGACSTSPDACAGLPEIALGDTHRFDLCAETGMTTFTRADGCGAGSPADSNDATFVLNIREPTNVLIDLRDADGSVAIDTIVYLRRTCDAPDTQLACSDDVSCSATAIPCGGGERVQVRESRIVTRLEPGTYYVVADAFVYDSFDCGVVSLTVTTP